MLDIDEPGHELTCCICKGEIEIEPNGWALGHNPEPIYTGEKNRACATCNNEVVIPTRLAIRTRRYKVEMIMKRQAQESVAKQRKVTH